MSAPTPSTPPEILVRVAEIARNASRILLAHFGRSHEALGVESKSDDSPVSRADRECDAFLRAELERLDPTLPIISEESRLPPYAERRAWDRFLLVDPLDGTKEFLRGSPDFTVNVACVEQGRPAWGVIHVPVEDLLVVGWKGKGAWRARAIATNDKGERTSNSDALDDLSAVLSAWEALAPIGSPRDDGGLRAALSQSHRHGSEDAALARFGLSGLVRRGSSLKFLLVALGEVDVYFRHTPTWEWDTAAGQAIVEASGGVVCDALGKPLHCNKETPLNGPFLACPVALKETCLDRIRRGAPSP